MKRFHVHIRVEDLDKSIAFYSRLFADPVRTEADYAKWMFDEPAVNFAVSTRGSRVGIDHLGFQTDDEEELARMKARAAAADRAMLDDGLTTCCYARSEKHWVTDPQGIAWERTLSGIPVYAEADNACCGGPREEPAAASGEAGCCGPALGRATARCC